MPIKPENKGRYPDGWASISHYVRFVRGGGQCECEGECGAEPLHVGRCRARHGEPHPLTLSAVVLTAAHLDHTPENCNLSNLKGMCQRCHLNYDKQHHARSRRASARNPSQFELSDD
jgi:hypothetical protein